MERKYTFVMVTERERRLPVVVSGLGVEEFQGHITRKEGFPLFHLVLCQSGRGLLKIDGKEIEIHPKEVFFFEPNVPHEYEPLEEPWTTLWIVFEGFSARAVMDGGGFGRWEVAEVSDSEFFLERFERIYRLVTEQPNDNALQASAELYGLLAELGRESRIRSNGKENSGSAKLRLVTDYILDHPTQDITLEELATVAGVSVSYLCRLFKKEYAMTPVSYILRHKIYEAKKQLIAFPNKTIQEIAGGLGFHDMSYFGLVFRKSEGCTPRQFRSQYVGEGK